MRTSRKRRGYTLMIFLALGIIFLGSVDAITNRLEVQALSARHAVKSLQAELLAEDALLLAMGGSGDTVERQGVGEANVEETRLENGGRQLSIQATAYHYNQPYKRTINVTLSPDDEILRVTRFGESE